MDRVGSDIITLFRAVERRRLAQKPHSTFTRIVHRQLRLPNQPLNAGNVDNRLALWCRYFLHAADAVFDAQEGSGGVDCHAAFPVFQGEVFKDRVADSNAGGVEEDIDGADGGFDSGVVAQQ